MDINLPSQVRNYANLGAFPITGSVKTIYIAEDSGIAYYWTGSIYAPISIQDLSGLVPQTRAINGYDLSANRTLSASDVGAPSGSGSSTGTNTGDETQSTILSKLETQELKVNGDQTTTSLTAVAVTDLESATLTAGKYAIYGSLGVNSSTSAGMKIGLNLPTGATCLFKALQTGATTAGIFNVGNSLGSVNFAPAANSPTIINIDGTITIGGTSGTVQFIFAKTSSGTATILDEGTFITIKKL